MYLGKKVSYYTLSFRERVKCIVKEQRRFEISQHGFYGAIYQSKLSPDLASYGCDKHSKHCVMNKTSKLTFAISNGALNSFPPCKRKPQGEPPCRWTSKVSEAIFLCNLSPSFLIKFHNFLILCLFGSSIPPT